MMPVSSSPNIVTSNSNNDTQAMLMQAMMANLKPEQQAPIQAALAAQARKAANRRYMTDTIRKLGPALTNGSITQPYTLSTPLTFNLSTSLNGYCEGIILRWNVNYNLAVGTAAVYAPTAAGKLGFIDTVEVRYNKSQIKVRPQVFRQLALLGGLDEYMVPEGVLVGQQDTYLQSWLNTALPITTGANNVQQEMYIPFNLISPDDPRGVLPLMAGDTGIQVIVNTPVSLLGPDAILNSIYVVSGTGGAMTAISGTVTVEAVFRDGDAYYTTNKIPFDITSVEGTFQMQIDQVLTPLVAGTAQRTKLNIMGQHYYVILLVNDAVQSNTYSTDANIQYLESAKDGIGGNTFWKYGNQTNLDYREWLFLNRLGGTQDLDPGVVSMINAPTYGTSGYERARTGKGYLDNTRTGWADWRWAVQVGTVGAQGTPRIEPHVFYVNPTGLVPV